MAAGVSHRAADRFWRRDHISVRNVAGFGGFCHADSRLDPHPGGNAERIRTVRRSSMNRFRWEQEPGRRRSLAGFIGALAGMVGLAVLAGAVAVCGVMPVAGAVSVATKRAAFEWQALPKNPPQPPIPGRTTLVSPSGQVVAQVFAVNRIPVAAAEQSELLRRAVVATEDADFYSHRGVDLRGTARAAIKTLTHSGVQGGSTITQQYVKNLRITQALLDGDGVTDSPQLKSATEGTLLRKLTEARMAMIIEGSTAKDDILTGYLNVSYFGQGAFGAEAAANRYFSKSASSLNLAEASLLAGLLQSPSRYDPILHAEAARERRSQVIDRMRDTGVISAADAAIAANSPVTLKPSTPRQGCEAAKPDWAFVCDAALRELAAASWMGAPTHRLLGAGGLTVRLTVDPKAQKQTNAAAAQVVPRRHRVADAVVMVEPGTGRVLALGTNRRFGVGPGKTEIPLATTASFSPGSTFKLFTLTAALEAGIPLSTRLPAGSNYSSTVFDNPPGGYHNAEGLAGSNVTIPEATQRSLNTAYVQLAERVGVEAVADAARRLGIRSVPAARRRNAPRRKEGSFVLGARDVSVIDMAGAYAAIAAHGRWCPPHLVDSITTPDGTVSKYPTEQCRQAVAAPVADTVSSVLESVITKGTGKSAALPDHRPAAGKTGTSEDAGAAWFTGFTPQAAAAVWIGDPRSPRNTLHDVLGLPIVYGGTLPAQLWKTTLSSYLKGKPIKALPGVDSSYLLGLGSIALDSVLVPDVVGLSAPEASARLTAAGLAPAVGNAPFTVSIQPGSVVAQSPRAGAVAASGSKITLSVAAASDAG